MNEVLKEVDKLIENSNNVPLELKPIVKAICKGYIRESNGKIPISGIINVCNTVFNKVDNIDDVQKNKISTSYDDSIFISAKNNINIEMLRKKILDNILELRKEI